MLALLLLSAARAHVPVIYVAGPDEDWCGVINATVGSDIVMLLPGVYTGPCDIVTKLSDMPNEQTVVQSFDPIDPAVFVAGAADYVIDASGISLLLMQVEFSDLPAGVTALRVGDIGDVWIRFSHFRNIPGDAIVQRGPIDVLSIGNSEFDAVGRAIRIGCDDGSCGVPQFDVDENLILGATLGVDVGRGSFGTLRDNVIAGTAAGLRLAGDPAGEIEVTGGLYETAGAAVEVPVGPVVLRANVAIGDPAVRAAGAGLAGVRIVGNTLVGALDLGGWAPGRDLALHSNAILGAVPDVGSDAAGNVGCDAVPGACFVAPGAWDFYPAPGSPLRGAGIDEDELGADWCGRVRESPPSAGALDAFGDLSIGPFAPVFKEDLNCALPESPDPTDPSGDTGEPPIPPEEPGQTPPTEDPGTPPSEEGCGCSGRGNGTGSAGLGLLWIPLALRIRGRRSARRTERSARPCP